MSGQKVEQSPLTQLGVDTMTITDENGKKRQVTDHATIKKELWGAFPELKTVSGNETVEELEENAQYKIRSDSEWNDKFESYLGIEKKGGQMLYLIRWIRAERKLHKEKMKGYDDTFDSLIDESYFTVGRKE